MGAALNYLQFFDYFDTYCKREYSVQELLNITYLKLKLYQVLFPDWLLQIFMCSANYSTVHLEVAQQTSSLVFTFQTSWL